MGKKRGEVELRAKGDLHGESGFKVWNEREGEDMLCTLVHFSLRVRFSKTSYKGRGGDQKTMGESRFLDSSNVPFRRIMNLSLFFFFFFFG